MNEVDGVQYSEVSYSATKRVHSFLTSRQQLKSGFDVQL